MNRAIFKYLLFALLLIGVACKRKTVIITSDPSNDLDNIEVTEMDFEYFNARSKIEYSDGGQEVKGKMNIRIKKDSLIWISVYGTALNIEAMRCLMTRDSIFLMDQINNTFYQYDYVQLSKKINFQIDYDLAENIIVGNMPRKKRRQDKFSRGKDYFLIKQSDDYNFIDNYIGSISNKLEKVEIINEPSRSSVVLSYGDFNTTEGKSAVFAYSSSLNIEYREKDKTFYTLLKIKHLKAEISDSPLSFPFRYSKK